VACERVKPKGIPLQAWTGPLGSRTLWFPEFLENRHMKVVRLSALVIEHLNPPEDIPVLICFSGLVDPRFKSKKNFNDPIGNRTRDFPGL